MLWSATTLALEQFRSGVGPSILGFTLGPDAGGRSWSKALAQYERRAALWAQLGLGLHHTCVAYNTYIASVLGFLLQLELLPADWPAVEERTLRKLIPGPARWIRPADLHNLRRHLCMPHDFHDMAVISVAARFRVAHREAASSGGLRVRQTVRRLDAMLCASSHIYRCGRWGHWFRQSFAHNLLDAVTECGRQGIDIRGIEADLGALGPQPHTRAITRRLAQGVQRATRLALNLSMQFHPETRLRQKLSKWSLPLFPRLRAMRAARLLPRLQRLAPPRVVSAVIRTWYNGWCTRRRFQQRGQCIFGCSLGADAVEHYICCSRLLRHGEQRLRLPPPTTFADRGVSFLLLEPRSNLPTDVLIRRALLLAAAYRLHCRLRHGAPIVDDEVLQRALTQAVKESAVGHARATQALDSIWDTTRRS